jgi:hypothetical protein
MTIQAPAPVIGFLAALAGVVAVASGNFLRAERSACNSCGKSCRF